MAVTHPVAGNLGGGGFALIRTADGNTYSLDFREMAPGKATRNMYLDAAGDVVPRLSLDGYLAAGVPGTVDRWGNAVAVTYTINDYYGSAAAVDGAGFLLNNEMDDFAIKPGVPNLKTRSCLIASDPRNEF